MTYYIFVAIKKDRICIRMHSNGGRGRERGGQLYTFFWLKHLDPSNPGLIKYQFFPILYGQ